MDRRRRGRPEQVDAEGPDAMHAPADTGEGLHDDAIVLPAQELLRHQAPSQPLVAATIARVGLRSVRSA